MHLHFALLVSPNTSENSTKKHGGDVCLQVVQEVLGDRHPIEGLRLICSFREATGPHHSIGSSRLSKPFAS